MECNRDEALRAIKIAEGKFQNKDFAGAKKLALKAQVLYPGLEGISQILTTMDVYISAEKKINSEVDWYGVLGLNPSADDEAIKKQYKKLALILHPDKNKSIGAEGAFKFLSEAWSLLSDKTKRLAYNQRRSINGYQQKIPVYPSRPSSPAKTNGYHNPGSRTTSAPKNQNNGVRVGPTSVPTTSRQRSDTFWTICHRCRMHYEYVKMYLNSTLLCPNCNKPFLASETSSPFSSHKSSTLPPRQKHPTETSSPFSSHKSSTFPPRQKHPNVSSQANTEKYFSRGRNAASAPWTHANFQQNSVPGNVATATRVVHQEQEKMKRAFNEPHVSGRSEGESSKRKLDDIYLNGMNHHKTWGAGGIGNSGLSGSRIHGFGSNSQLNSYRELSPLEIRKLLMGKAQKEIVKKLNEWKPEAKAHAAADKEKGKDNKRQKYKNTSNIHKVNSSTDNNSDQEVPRVAAMDVPDPDFYDFDQDRTESSFGENEVWASYDNDDGMPRFYALIHKVISKNPFKLRISWLNSKTNSEFGPMEWVGKGFYKTCGEFRVGKYEACKSINSFSQKVNWSKGPNGTVQIFPKRNDVWALYKNWSSDWNEHTLDDVVHKYDMVMVLDDYNEEHGVSVAPLVKVVGFKTVFRPDLVSGKVKRICKEEMFRFSHLVPSRLLTGQEAQNAPKGFFELDPAATPLELLQVLTESNDGC